MTLRVAELPRFASPVLSTGARRRGAEEVALRDQQIFAPWAHASDVVIADGPNPRPPQASVESHGQRTGALMVVAIPAATTAVAIPGVHPPNDVITV